VRAPRRYGLCLLGLGLLWAGGAPAQAPDGLEARRAWEECRARRAPIERVAGRLRASADSIAGQRTAARARGDAAAEQEWLGRGEALADSIEQVAAALLAADLFCRPIADELAGEIAAALDRAAADASPLGAARRDSLLALRRRLQEPSTRAAPVEFPLPEATADDPPEILLLKSAYARDLADRAGRWLQFVHGEREAIEHERLARATRRLLDDQSFFEERAVLPADPATVEGAAGSAGLLRALLAGLPGLEAPAAPLSETLGRLEAFLTARREALSLRGDELEREASRRERER
jgi:hypothetical protein